MKKTFPKQLTAASLFFIVELIGFISRTNKQKLITERLTCQKNYSFTH